MYSVLCVCVYVLHVCYGSFDVVPLSSNPEETLPTPIIIDRAGYICETHSVITEDGYILQVHRIPGTKSTGINPSLNPIILQHGLLDSSADWVLTGPKKALGFLLADRGYDVWLGNARGNPYSRANINISFKNKTFWEFTWHEMGYYDIPAVIDYILNKTNHQQVDYVGHSMGTTMFFVMCSMRPEYNDKVSTMIALAPVAYLGYTQSPVEHLASFWKYLEMAADYFGHGEFSITPWGREMMTTVCEVPYIKKITCENVLFMIAGFDEDQLDENLLPLIMGHIPAGTSIKTIAHYAQEILSNEFCQFDYGKEKNIEKYNSPEPPNYDLSKVSTPIYVIYATNDLLADTKDVKRLYTNLKGKKSIIKVNYEKFNHLDFLWARIATALVYNTIFQILKTEAPSTTTETSITPERKESKTFDENDVLYESEKKSDGEQKAKINKKNHSEEKIEMKVPPKEEKGIKYGDGKFAEMKKMFYSVQEKLPAWQNSISEKLSVMQKFVTKKFSSIK